MPDSPAELVSTEPDPLQRFVLVTAWALRDRRLDSVWAQQRLADLRLLLTSDPPVPKCKIAADSQISKPRVSELARIALGESRG